MYYRTCFHFCIALLTSVLPVFASPDWQAEGENVLDGYGYCLGSAGDINNDGYDDVFVSAPFAETEQTMHGRVYLYHGSREGLRPAGVLDGSRDKQTFGRSVCSAGDVNGDGYDDLLVGAPGTTDTLDGQGAALLYHGTPDGISPAPAWIALGEVEQGRFGFSVAGIGDVNNDGYDDVLVGAPYHSEENNELCGLVRLYLGSASGLSSASLWSCTGTRRSRFGWQLAGDRDMDGNGIADFVVAAPGDCSRPQTSRLHVYGFDSELENTVKELQVLSAGSRNYRLGENGIALADINGDGFTDLLAMPLIFKDNTSIEQSLWCYTGSTNTLQENPETIPVWPRTNLEHYRPVFQCVDINNDEIDDVVIGNAFATIPDEEQGALVILPGSREGLQKSCMSVVPGTETGGWLGETVASAGDVNGDGRIDLLAGGRIPDGNYQRGKAMLWTDPAALSGCRPVDLVHPEPSTEGFMDRFYRVKADRLERHMVDQPWKELLEISPKLVRMAEDSDRLNPANCCHWMLGYLEEMFGDMEMGNRHYKRTELLIACQWSMTSCKWHRSADLACLMNNRAENLTYAGQLAAAGPIARKAVALQDRCDREGQEKSCWKKMNHTYRMMGYSVRTAMACQLWYEGQYEEALARWQELLDTSKQDDTPTSTHNIAASLAAKLSFLGDHASAIATLQDALTYEPDPHYAQHTPATRLLLAVITASYSGFTEELLAQAEKDSAQIKALEDNKYYWESRKTIAKLLFLAGRHDASIRELDTLIEAAEKHGYLVLQASAYELRALNHFALGNFEQAAADCRKALLMFRQMGLKYREPDLYLLYARCEEALGKNDRALNTWKTAVELARQLGLSDLWKQHSCRPELCDPDPATFVSCTATVGIVPSLMTTEIQQGEAARTRFLVGNLTGKQLEGYLLVTATGLKIDPELLPIIRLIPTEDKGTTPQPVPIMLSPFETTPVYLECTTPEKLYGSEVILSWKGSRNSAGWFCAPSREDSVERRIIHAGYIKENPFQCAVFYHEIRPDAESDTPRNLRAIASRSCRIEFVDLETKSFLAADHNGDGDFNDPGDLIWSDIDNNLYPDFPADGYREIEIRAYPASMDSSNPLVITVGRMMDDGDWVDEAVDVLNLSP